MSQESSPLPSVSIVVPVYNGQRTIEACVESLLAQNYPKDLVEILIVDNNSIDRTCEIVRAYPVRLLHERERQSSYAARNTGIRNAQGEILAFTDADCVADEAWVREIVAPFVDRQVGGVGGWVLDASPTNAVESFLCSMGLFSRYQTEGAFLPVLLTANVAYRKEILLAVGLFNQDLYTGADVDLAWRMQLSTGAQVAYVREAVVHHRHRATLRTMVKQLYRQGFGEILIDAMYVSQPGYRRTRGQQLRRMVSQVRALLTYVASFGYRLLVSRAQGKDREYVLSPLLWFAAESANIRGKIYGLWATRLLTSNPAEKQWEDPGER